MNNFVRSSSWLQPERVHKRAQAVPQQTEFAAPIEFVPLNQQFFAITQLRFPLLSPIGAQSSWHDHAYQRNQPDMDPYARFSSLVKHWSQLCFRRARYSRRKANNGSVFAAWRAGR